MMLWRRFVPKNKPSTSALGQCERCPDHLRDWPDSIQLRFKGTKALAHWKDFEKKTPGYLLTQDHLEKYFPAFGRLGTQKALLSAGLGITHKMLVLQACKFKSCEVTAVSTQTSKGPRSWVICHRVWRPAASPKKMCANQRRGRDPTGTPDIPGMSNIEESWQPWADAANERVHVGYIRQGHSCGSAATLKRGHGRVWLRSNLCFSFWVSVLHHYRCFWNGNVYSLLSSWGLCTVFLFLQELTAKKACFES